MNMKRILCLLPAAALALAGCGGGEKETGASETATSDTAQAAQAPAPVLQQVDPAAAPAAQPAAAAGKTWHYICPNGHDGAEGEGTCGTCGAALVHNQAFHAGDMAAQPQMAPAQPNLQQGQPQPMQMTEPPQNAKGAWHYTCPSGHAGGSGSATACATCGATLVHNQAYHQ
jgi:hypothetical protein